VSDQTKAFGLLLGRLLLCPIFLLSGTVKIVDWSKTAESMTQKGMALVPEFLVAAIVVELLGGLCLLFGYKARYGAILLTLYLIPVTIVFHSFWAAQGAARELQLQHFLKNLTIMGGLCTLAAAGAGRYSLSTSLRKSTARDRLGPVLAIHSLCRPGGPLETAYLAPYGLTLPASGPRDAKIGLSVRATGRNRPA
jgi:putative oxidoreductase